MRLTGLHLPGKSEGSVKCILFCFFLKQYSVLCSLSWPITCYISRHVGT